jgi:hypothetical protein
VNRRIDDLVQKICDLKNFFQLKLSQQDFTPQREYALKIHQRMMRGLLMLKQQDCYKLVGKESDSEFAIFVKSSSSPDKNYLVTIIPPNAKSKDAGSASCTCLDSVPILCKHIHLAIHVSGKSYEAFGLHVGSRRVQSASDIGTAVDSASESVASDDGMDRAESLEDIPTDFEATVLSWSVGETCDKISALPRHLRGLATDISTNVLRRLKSDASKTSGEAARLYKSLQCQSTVWKKTQRRKKAKNAMYLSALK